MSFEQFHTVKQENGRVRNENKLFQWTIVYKQFSRKYNSKQFAVCAWEKSRAKEFIHKKVVSCECSVVQCRAFAVSINHIASVHFDKYMSTVCILFYMMDRVLGVMCMSSLNILSRWFNSKYTYIDKFPNENYTHSLAEWLTECICFGCMFFFICSGGFDAADFWKLNDNERST